MMVGPDTVPPRTHHPPVERNPYEGAASFQCIDAQIHVVRHGQSRANERLYLRRS